MHAKELRGVELVLERLHRFTDQITPFADDQLGVRSARRDVVDLADRDEAHLPARFDADAIDVAGGRFQIVSDLDGRRFVLA